MWAEFDIGSVVDSRVSRLSCRAAEELDMEMPAAAMARVRITVTVKSLPGVVSRKDQMRRARRAGPAKGDIARWVAGLKAGSAGDVRSSSQWSPPANWESCSVGWVDLGFLRRGRIKLGAPEPVIHLE